MYVPRPNRRDTPTLAKRCLGCGRFLFKRNLGENERYHRIGKDLFVCHKCFIKATKERENQNELNKESQGLVEPHQQGN
jgi:hypothetical protein